MYDFLRSNGFELINKETSLYFGDYYEIFSNNKFQLRFSSSKSIKAVDIKSVSSNEEWYDLALVKALLYGEKDLNCKINIKEQEMFLFKEFTNISIFFDDKNYSAVRKKLNELGNERVRQMFPALLDRGDSKQGRII